MFTGIIESLGTIISKKNKDTNVIFNIDSNISSSLKINQSVAHNGVCLTIIDIVYNTHTVVAIKETLIKTNLSYCNIGSKINLERCMPINGRFDGHIVQGHIDQTALCIEKKEEAGSWYFTFLYDTKEKNITVEKGSVSVNGVSLTVIDSKNDRFTVAIIPHTYQHTTFKYIQLKSVVNVEFDILGKYVQKILNLPS